MGTGVEAAVGVCYKGMSETSIRIYHRQTGCFYGTFASKIQDISRVAEDKAHEHMVLLTGVGLRVGDGVGSGTGAMDGSGPMLTACANERKRKEN